MRERRRPEMWRTKKLFILTAVLVPVLIVGATASIALAQDETGGKRGALFARVAEILGIEQQKVEDAFKQASQELKEEARNQKLQDLVDNGNITQQEADEYKAWLESRPDDIRPAPLHKLEQLVEEGTITQQQLDEYTAWMESKPDIPIASYLRENKMDGLLDRLVENGTLTQAQADEYRAWMESKPDVPRVHPGKLDQLVEEGVITQEQADAYTSWLEAKPDIQLPKSRTQQRAPRMGFGGGPGCETGDSGKPLTF
jgi:polyhydroxyalkanoate synthesis regulator phasin